MKTKENNELITQNPTEELKQDDNSINLLMSFLDIVNYY